MESIAKNLEGTPGWLRKIQSRSWEAELLVSSGAFFSLYTFSDYAMELTLNSFEVSFFGGAFSLIPAALKLLSIYFLVHLTARGFWLSLIFLLKIYPEGIKIENLHLKEPYLSNTKRFRLFKRIKLLDNLCSLLFSLAFTLAALLFGIAIGFSIVMIPSVIFLATNSKALTLLLIFLIPILLSFYLFLADTLFHGFLRRSAFFSRLYYPIYSFWNTLSLGFLWRPNLQVIFSHAKNKWKVSLLIIGVSAIGFLLASDGNDFISILDNRKYQTANIIMNEYEYENKLSPEKWSQITIQSDIITDNYLKLFVPYSWMDDTLIDSLKTKEKYFHSIFKISLNDSICNELSWTGIVKTNGQKGIISVIDIERLGKGLNTLTVEKLNLNDAKKIPFWKQ